MGIYNEIPKYVVVALWLAINGYLFASTYHIYASEKEYYYLKYIMKDGLPVARGAAAVLQFNCMLVLLPVCRNLLSFIKEITCMPRGVLRLLDMNITFHKMIAYMICAASAVHVGAHVYNFENLASSWYRQDVITDYLNMYDINYGTHTELNPIRKAGLDPIMELLKTVAGTTGVIITLALIVIISSSTELIRRSYFEVFWFTHHLFIIFFIGLLIHGTGMLLKYQNNTLIHDPVYCANQTIWSKKVCPVSPNFVGKPPDSWKWVLAPLVIYFIERCVRFYRSFQKCEIKKIIKHPSRVIELQMKKSGFYAEAGQYIFLYCPSISKLEWHPFTLTSCPEEDFFSVHIRIVGDWTEKLAESCNGFEKNVNLCRLQLSCDGPFGTASSDVFRYKIVMCIGAGIGITPFASILKSIWYRQQKDSNLAKIKKVYFYWICPDTNAFEWFADLLRSLEKQMCEKGLTDLLEYNIYLTRGWRSSDAWNIALHETDTEDAITGLYQKTNFGRPDWDKIFSSIQVNNKGSNIGVFFCGPKVLSHVLHKKSNKYSSGDTKFVYNKENF